MLRNSRSILKSQASVWLFIFLFLGCSPKVGTEMESASVTKTDLPEEYDKLHWEDWKNERLEDLLAPKGWFSLIGLHWLKEGDNNMGSDPSSSIKLPGTLPAHMGTFRLHEGSLSYSCPKELNITMNGDTVSYIDINPATGWTQEFNYGSYYWHVIERNGKYGVRIKDASIPGRIRISAIPYYDYNPDLIVTATAISTNLTDSIKISNVLGMENNYRIADKLKFNLYGKTYILNALGNPQSDYFVIISDNTSGVETYGGGRYLYVPRSTSGDNKIIIDFNRAINPPCVFTDYATCPLPPESNHLDLELRAGEKKWNH